MLITPQDDSEEVVKEVRLHALWLWGRRRLQTQRAMYQRDRGLLLLRTAAKEAAKRRPILEWIVHQERRDEGAQRLFQGAKFLREIEDFLV